MLNTAIEAAQQAGLLALGYFKKQPKVLYKPDNTPVTRADKEAEKLIRSLVSSKFPDHGFIGEEFGATNPKAKYQWVIDPIDGTKSFVRGIKGWGTLLAVLEDNKPIIGVYFSPATDEIFTCQKGKGTYLNGKKIHVSKVKDVSKSFIVHSSLNHFKNINKVGNLVKLAETAQGKRGASDCDGVNMVLKGQADLYVAGKGYIWDFAAPAILVDEAGGKYTDLNNTKRLDSGTTLLTNGIIHNQVLDILNSK